MMTCPDKNTCFSRDLCKHTAEHEKNEHCNATSYCPACVEVDNVLTLKPHPETCPNCKSNIVFYERFAGKHGEYVCDDCGWAQDSVTGEIVFKGESEEVDNASAQV